MAKNKSQVDVNALKAKENRQAKKIEEYKKQRRWVAWATGIIAILILLLLGTMGYASNWWLNPTRTSSVTPTSLTSGTGSETGGTGGTTSTTGTTGTNSTTNTTTTTPGTNSSNTVERNNSSTTTNNTTTTTNNNTTTPQQSALINLSGLAQVGADLDSVLNQARIAGLNVACQVDILTVQVCTVSDDQGGSIILKRLLGSGNITGVTLNL